MGLVLERTSGDSDSLAGEAWYGVTDTGLTATDVAITRG